MILGHALLRLFYNIEFWQENLKLVGPQQKTDV